MRYGPQGPRVRGLRTAPRRTPPPGHQRGRRWGCGESGLPVSTPRIGSRRWDGLGSA
jgi:hypothetical protein